MSARGDRGDHLRFPEGPYPPPAEPVGRVQAMDPDGTARVMATGFTCCNGIALTPDRAVIVVEERGLMRVDDDATKTWITRDVGSGGGDGRSLFATDGMPGQIVVWEGMPVAGRAVNSWRPTSGGSGPAAVVGDELTRDEAAGAVEEGRAE